MKKAVAIILLLVLPLVASAGNTFKLYDIIENPIQEITLGLKDRIQFDMFDGTHTVIINAINSKGIELDLFPFINFKDKPPVSYATANYENIVYFDVNKDGIKDISIKLINMDNESATLRMTNINQEGKINYNNTITDNTTKDILKIKDNLLPIAVILGVLIVSLIVYFKYKK